MSTTPTTASEASFAQIEAARRAAQAEGITEPFIPSVVDHADAQSAQEAEDDADRLSRQAWARVLTAAEQMRAVPDTDRCPDCGGNGATPATDLGPQVTCRRCKGTGEVLSGPDSRDAAIARILALHSGDGNGACTTCRDIDGEREWWPCDTYVVLRDAGVAP